MLFHSFTFIIFFLILLAGLGLFRNNARIYYMLGASYLFYGWWNPYYLILLLGLTLFAYGMAFLSRGSRMLFGFVLAGILLPLGIFKYTGFFARNITSIFGTEWSFDANWQLPIGISFITFTLIAYLVDVRKRILEPEKSFAKIALYVSFFPQLIAGPIMRPRELLPQLKHLFFKPHMVKLGLFLFAVGMTKKVVFADQIAIWIDQIYDPASTQSFFHSAFVFYGFPVQIYCDFSGYTDMAMGIALMLGIRLPLNFNRPYTAVSIRDFWRRWHITLSRWLRDYLYIPLGGSRKGYAATSLTLAITMILGGLWHGAAWTFVIWGALHALFLIAEHGLKRIKPSGFGWPKWLKIFVTFHLVGIAWILFRARGPSEVYHILSGFVVPGNGIEFLSQAFFPVSLIAIFLMFHFRDRLSYWIWLVTHLPGAFIYAAALSLILFSKALSIGNPSAFIYFDF